MIEPTRSSGFDRLTVGGTGADELDGGGGAADSCDGSADVGIDVVLGGCEVALDIP